MKTYLKQERSAAAQKVAVADPSGQDPALNEIKELLAIVQK